MSPAPTAALVLLHDPIEVRVHGFASVSGLPGTASANPLRRIRHHPSASLEGCLGFALGALKGPGNDRDIDALIRPRAALLRSRGIATKAQLVDLLATAQALDLLGTMIHGGDMGTTPGFGAGAPRQDWRFGKPAGSHLPGFMRHRGPCTPRSATAGCSEVVRKVVATWRDPALGVPAGIAMACMRLRQEEASGQAGPAHLLARVDLEDCIDRLRTTLPQHACEALQRTGRHAADIAPGLEKAAAAGRRALGSAFALGKDEVQAELTSKGGWASHSLLMAGLVATAVPGPAHPHGAATGSEPAAAWEARAAQVLCDMGRLAILLTVYDIWGVASEPCAARTQPS